MSDTAAAEIPEGYEPAEISNAKDQVMVIISDYAEPRGLEITDEEDLNGVDSIELADQIVEKLLSLGVTFPEGIPGINPELQDKLATAS